MIKQKKITSLFFAISLTACSSQFQGAQWDSGIPSTQESPIEEEILPIGQDGTPIQADPIDHSFESLVETFFAINRTLVRLAHDFSYTWQGCSSIALVSGGYDSDSKCGNAFFQPLFEKQMNYYFFQCVERASLQAKLSIPKKIFINHYGSYNDRAARGTNRLSLHAYARALDIVNFNLLDETGRITRISTNVRNYRGTTKIFYDEFRQCWKEKMPASCTPNQTEYKGSIGIPQSPLGGNNLHNDHIHLSYALCGG